jgi:PAS domain S-box-containing protein
MEVDMRIAVVGGGRRCRALMRVVERYRFQKLNPEIVAVADPKQDAPGYREALSKGLFVTHDYNDFFKRDDIDLIIEFTGDMDIYNDILDKKNRSVRAISEKTAQLFWEIARLDKLQKKTDQELQETRAIYRAVMDQLIQEDVMVIAWDHRIIDINDKLLDRLGLRREKVIGRHCYEITHHQSSPCSGEQHPCPLVQTLETSKPSQTVHCHLDKDKNEIYYSISTYPLKEDGEVIGAIEISRDITEDINMQKAMMHQEKLVSIGRLSAGVAHEINNPLTTILTTTMLIQEDLSPEDPNHAELETVVNETLRCREIVTSLLEFARQTQPRKDSYDINTIVHESIVLTQKQAAFKDVRLSERLDPALPSLELDKGQIQQSLINLILNAVEATAAGGEIMVESRMRADSDNIEVKVSDTGDGISKENLARIFDPFFTTKESGTGLGLAITYGIVEQHGGTIEVQSKPGAGTTFTIKLPLPSGGSNGA